MYLLEFQDEQVALPRAIRKEQKGPHREGQLGRPMGKLALAPAEIGRFGESKRKRSSEKQS